MTFTPEDKEWINGRIERSEARLAEQMQKAEAQFAERLEKVETTLLAGFHDWAQPVNARMRSYAGDIRAIQVDVEALQDRLDKLEGKKLS